MPTFCTFFNDLKSQEDRRSKRTRRKKKEERRQEDPTKTLHCTLTTLITLITLIHPRQRPKQDATRHSSTRAGRPLDPKTAVFSAEPLPRHAKKACLDSLVVEHCTCNAEVLGSTPSSGLHFCIFWGPDSIKSGGMF